MSGIYGDKGSYPFVTRGRLAALGLSIVLSLMLSVPLSHAATVTTSATPSAPVATPVFSKITQLRAAFALNALKFTIWPEQRINASTSIRVVLVGEDDVSRLLHSRLPDYTVLGKPIEVFSAEDLERDAISALLQEAHAVYFALNTHGDYAALIASISSPALTISSIDGFAQTGGMVEITLKENRRQLEFRINRGNLAKANVVLSSALMKISRIVN